MRDRVMTPLPQYRFERATNQINPGLLWEYRLDNFDWQKYRKIVVERVISLGRLTDWYAAFDLYGGIRGFKKIARDEVMDISPRDLNFICHVFGFDKTETRYYKHEMMRKDALAQR